MLTAPGSTKNGCFLHSPQLKCCCQIQQTRSPSTAPSTPAASKGTHAQTFTPGDGNIRKTEEKQPQDRARTKLRNARALFRLSAVAGAHAIPGFKVPATAYAEAGNTPWTPFLPCKSCCFNTTTPQRNASTDLTGQTLCSIIQQQHLTPPPGLQHPAALAAYGVD